MTSVRWIDMKMINFPLRLPSIISDFRRWRYIITANRINPKLWLSIDKRIRLNEMMECYKSQSHKQTSSDTMQITFLSIFFSSFVSFSRLCFRMFQVDFHEKSSNIQKPLNGFTDFQNNNNNITQCSRDLCFALINILLLKIMFNVNSNAYSKSFVPRYLIDCVVSWQKTSMFMTLKFATAMRDFDSVYIQMLNYKIGYSLPAA